MRLIVRSILSASGITVGVARFLSASFIVVLLLFIYLDVMSARSFGQTPFSLVAVVNLAIIAVIATSFAWLGFSAHGKSLLAEIERHRAQNKRPVRLLRVIVATSAMAGGIWLIVIELATRYGTADLGSELLESWGLYALLFLCLPIAYRWFK